MIPEKLKMRGNIGINKGLGVDEVSVDLTEFNPGIIAISGVNGSGKTTLIENLIPHRTPVSRSANIADMFYLRDSSREVEFDINGNKYKSVVLVDAKTRKCEAYLYKNGKPLNDGKTKTYDEEIQKIFGTDSLFFNSVFNGQQTNNISSMSPAEKKRLMFELLSLSSYEAHETTAKERISEIEKELYALDMKISERDITNEKLISKRAILEAHRHELHELETQSLDDKKLLFNADEGVDSLRKELEEAIVQESEQKAKSERMSALAKQQSDLRFSIDKDKKDALANLGDQHIKDEKQLRDEINDLVTAYNKKTIPLWEKCEELELKINEKTKELLSFGDAIKRAETLQAELIKLEKAKSFKEEKVSGRGEALQEKSKLQEKITSYKEIISRNEAIKSKISEKESLRDSVLKEIEMLQEKIKDAERRHDAINGVPCSEEVGRGCLFIKDAYEIADTIPGYKQQIDEHDKEIASLNKVILEIADTVEDVNPQEIESLEHQIKNIDVVLASISESEVTLKTINEGIKKFTAEKHDLEQGLKSRDQLKHEIELMKSEFSSKQEIISDSAFEYKAQKEKLEAKSDQLAAEYSEQVGLTQERFESRREELLTPISIELNKLTEESKDWPKVSSETIKGKIESLLGDKKNIEKRLAQLQEFANREVSEIKLAESQIAELEKKVKGYEDVALQVREIRDHLAEWTYIAKAMSKNGIPLMKLNIAGERVTQIANALLRVFDNDFTISFETTKLSKDGKKSLDTFDIAVVEVDPNGELVKTPIEMKSGGQRVWIETALQLAIAVILKQESRNVNSMFIDEHDGALDAESANKYLQMIQLAANMSGVSHIFLITHNQDLIAQISQRIICVPEKSEVLVEAV